MSETRYTHLPTPIGPLLLAGADQRLSHVGFPAGKGAISPRPDWRHDETAFADARTQLLEYFDGTRQAFDLALDPGGTDFQRTVWQELARIPLGVTISYRDLATRIGSPTATRAVGAANGRNPLPIILPCHRVIGANGALTGFGGGLPTKAWLLDFEKSHAALVAPPSP